MARFSDLPLPAFVLGGGNVDEFINDCKDPSAEQLRAKSGKTMVGGAVAGHCNFLLKQSHERTKWGKNIAAQVLPDLQGKGHERKEAFWLT